MRVGIAAVVLSLGLAITLIACGGEPEAADPTSTSSESASVATVVTEIKGADGTTATAGGYTIGDVSLPAEAGTPGKLSFTITKGGDPVTDYIEEQTKDIHVYVVRDDLEVFRHVHPTQGDDGAWSGDLTLPAGGTYRVVAEFAARTPDDKGEQAMLGATAKVAGPTEVDVPGSDDGVVIAALEETPKPGIDQEIGVLVSDPAGNPVNLGTYLGVYAHVTAFSRETGEVIHLHPLGGPENVEGGTRLGIHVKPPKAGDYVFFAQVRVDGMIHTLRLPVTV
ncbi:hypothetical protein [Nocardioides albus]|uniref:Heavy metal-binding domain-containing protein n=1 Tax=Nocardioides albus TaxID=1841 RepID=A0A7W5A5G7_9ACTN|nr:hypothetical protein [Nocardioides albus]MBB3089916.1 hypothetical protein [Nocardioides albus]GGU36567.1 hypothetical protein GCM10007979_39610 [Nocardioides albus]